jgi:hypothetical protein
MFRSGQICAGKRTLSGKICLFQVQDIRTVSGITRLLSANISCDGLPSVAALGLQHSLHITLFKEISVHIPSLPANAFMGALSQTLTGSAARVSGGGAKGFESDLASGNIAGAQSFLSTLQQKLSTDGSGGTGTAISAQLKQVSTDLSSGNVSAAQSDFQQLKSGISQLHAQAVPGSQYGAGDLNQALAATGVTTSSLASYALQQGAFTGALNLSSPSTNPSFSINA